MQALGEPNPESCGLATRVLRAEKKVTSQDKSGQDEVAGHERPADREIDGESLPIGRRYLHLADDGRPYPAQPELSPEKDELGDHGVLRQPLAGTRRGRSEERQSTLHLPGAEELVARVEQELEVARPVPERPDESARGLAGAARIRERHRVFHAEFVACRALGQPEGGAIDGSRADLNRRGRGRTRPRRFPRNTGGCAFVRSPGRPGSGRRAPPGPDRAMPRRRPPAPRVVRERPPPAGSRGHARRYARGTARRCASRPLQSGPATRQPEPDALRARRFPWVAPRARRYDLARRAGAPGRRRTSSRGKSDGSRGGAERGRRPRRPRRARHLRNRPRERGEAPPPKNGLPLPLLADDGIERLHAGSLGPTRRLDNRA